MTQETLVFILGLILFLTPFLGIPTDWKVYVYVITAVLLLLVGYRLRYARFLRSLENGQGERKLDSYVETTGESFTSQEQSV
jgi:membrane protein implicated in regulation of membrane protease activity